MNIEKSTKQHQALQSAGLALAMTGILMNFAAMLSHSTYLAIIAVGFMVVGVVELARAHSLGKKLGAAKQGEAR